MLDFSGFEWWVAIVCAILIGFAKTGMVGVGVLVVAAFALMMPAKDSTGFVLPMLAFADIMAIIYWRRHVGWRLIRSLLPGTILGIVLGYLCLDWLSDDQLMPVLGLIILVQIAINYWLDKQPRLLQRLLDHRGIGVVMGALMGATSMLANAAGTIMTVYLLTLRYEKRRFVGTGALYFWMVNLMKIPFSVRLKLIDPVSLKTNLVLAPCIVLGGLLGIFLVERISQKWFNRVVTLLAVLASLYLCSTAVW